MSAPARHAHDVSLGPEKDQPRAESTLGKARGIECSGNHGET